MLKRSLSMLLAVVMVLSMLPVPAFASEEAEGETQSATEAVTEAPATTAATEAVQETTVPAQTEAAAPTEAEETTTPATQPRETTAPTVPEEPADPTDATAETLPSISLFAADSITWSFDESTGTLTISGSGAMENYSSSPPAPWVESYQKKITQVVIEDGVTTIGDSAFYDCTSLTSVTIPSGVTSIGDSAFGLCDKLTSVDIPSSVTYIDAYAFFGCSSLTSVTIPDSVTTIGDGAFMNCFGLKSVNIPSGVTTIYNSTFSFCEELRSITIPSSVTSIGSNAFSYCPGLILITFRHTAADPLTIEAGAFKLSAATATTVNVPNKTSINTAISGYDWTGSKRTVTYSSKVEAQGTCGENLTWVLDNNGTLTISGTGAMENYDFSPAPWMADYQTKITRVIIGNGVTSIGFSAFRGCTGVTSVTIPSGVTTIGDSAFYDCTGLTSVTIPSGVTRIDYCAFQNCSGLTSITIPSSVTYIGVFAFYDCTGLTAVHISDLTAWCSIDFAHETSNPLEYAHNLYLNGQLVTDLAIPDGIASIGNHAFHECTSLTSATIPSSVTSIGEYAFSGCTSLASVTIPSSVTSMGSSAFHNCTGLSAVHISDLAVWCGIDFGESYSITNPLYYADYLYLNGNPVTDLVIPDGVTSIGSSAFRRCTGLTSVTIPSSVKTIGNDAFSGCTKLNEITFQQTAEDSLTIGTDAFYLSAATATTVEVPNKSSINTAISGYDWTGSKRTVTYSSEVEAQGTCGENLTWQFNAETGTLTISGSGAMKDYSYATKAPWMASYQTEITQVIIEEGVTTIGSMAFYGCTNLKIVYIPDSVTTISASSSDYSPFYRCSSDLMIFCGAASKPNGWSTYWNRISDAVASVFWNCAEADYAYWSTLDKTQSNIQIPDGVTIIPAAAFYNCTNLTSVTIPDSVTSIGHSAFSGCTGLKRIYIPAGVGWVGQPFSGCSDDLAIYCGAKSSLGEWYYEWNSNGSKYLTVFWGCPDGDYDYWSTLDKTTSSIRIPDGVTAIPSGAFRNCTNLTNITIPDSVTSIGSEAFYGCTGLTSITIPDSVTSIGSEAFYGCTGLTSITIPDSVIAIGEYAFYDCTGLTSITIQSGVTFIGSYAFHGCTGLTNVTIPGSVTTIGYWSFYGCTGLTSVTIQPGVTTIGRTAFENCTALKSIYIPASVTTISASSSSDSPFYGCPSDLVIYCGAKTRPGGWDSYWNYGRTVCWNCPETDYAYWSTLDRTQSSIRIPDGITTIPTKAFYNLTGLKSVYIPDSVVSISASSSSESPFYGCSEDLLIYCVAEAKPSEWGSYWDYTGDKHLTASWGCVQEDLGYWNKLDKTGNIVIPNGIQTIPDYIFRDCTGVTSVTIPDSVTTIGKDAFSGCTGLTSVTIPDSVTSIGEGAFSGCTGLTGVTIPGSVTSIGDRAFSGCTALKCIYIPIGVTTISASSSSYSPFYGCSGDLAIYCGAQACPGGWDSYWNYTGNNYLTAHWNCPEEDFNYWSTLDKTADRIEIQRGIKTIPGYIFQNCTGLTSVTIPDSVTTIGSYAFSGCTGLKGIYIPDSVTSVSGNLFNSCSSDLVIYCGAASRPGGWSSGWNESGYNDLPVYWNCTEMDCDYWSTLNKTASTIVIENGITVIPARAFEDCTNLTDITIPDSITTIGNYAFKNCTGLTCMVLPEGVTSIGSYAFEWCTGLKGVYIPTSVTSISYSPFYHCSDDLVLYCGAASEPSGWNQNWDYTGSKYLVAYWNCTERDCTYWNTLDKTASTIAIEDGITVIPARAFEDCTDLTSITIPGSVTTIGSNAFRNCTALKSIYIPDSVDTLSYEYWHSDGPFYGCSGDLVIYCGAETCPSEWNSNWNYNGNKRLATCWNCTETDYAYWSVLDKNQSSIEIPKGITVIPEKAFYQSKLESVTIPNTVTTIGESAFSGCVRLTSIAIPGSVTSIGNYAFNECTGLNGVYISDLAAWCSIRFDGYNANPLNCAKKLYLDGKLVTNLRIPDGVTAISDRAFENCTSLTSVTIPEGVTTIGNGAFSDCENLTSMILPDSLETIGSRAFAWCNDLRSIYIPAGVTTISGSSAYDGPFSSAMAILCEAQSEPGEWGTYWNYSGNSVLPTYWGCNREQASFWANVPNMSGAVEIPDFITEIPAYAFRGCRNITSISIPDSIKTIGKCAFQECRALRGVYIPASVTTISASTYEESPFYRSSVQKIYCGAEKKPDGWGDYWNYSYDDATYWGYNRTEGTFWSSVSNTDGAVVIPEGITRIPERAFSDCHDITSITIPNTVKSIGKEAFQRCWSLKNIYIPASVDTITADNWEESPFCYTNIQTIYCGAKSKPDGWSDYWNCRYENEYLTVYWGYGQEEGSFWGNISGLGGDVVIPNGITSIPEEAFFGRGDITSVVIPASVTTIGRQAFSWCENLKTVYFLGSAPSIASDAFAGADADAWYFPASSWNSGKFTGYSGTLYWQSIQAQIRDVDGKNAAGTTAWINTTGNPTATTFTPYTDPVLDGLNFTWNLNSDVAAMVENADGSVTVKAESNASGTGVLTLSINDTEAARVNLQFTTLELSKDESPEGEENPADLRMFAGKNRQLTVMGSDGKALTAKQIKWRLPQQYAAFATVSASGKLTARAVLEKTRIEVVGTIIGSESTTVTYTVDIYPLATQMEVLLGGEVVNGKTIDIRGNTTLNVRLYPLDAAQGWTWTVSDSKRQVYAEYDFTNDEPLRISNPTGKAGTVTVKATATDGSRKSVSFKLRFGTFTDSIEITNCPATFSAAEKPIQLVAQVQPENVSTRGVVWSLKNPADKNFVSLSASGKLTAKAVNQPVKVTLVAASKDGCVSTECTVKILPKDPGMLVLKDETDKYVTKTTILLDLNSDQNSVTLSAHTFDPDEKETVTWSPAADTKVAQIQANEDGTLTVTMTKPGTQKITAVTADKRKAEVTIKAVALATGLTISQKKTNATDLRVASGKSIELQAALTRTTFKKVTWSLAGADKAWASISTSGKLTAKPNLTAQHTVTVTATAADGSGAANSIPVTIYPLATGVQVFAMENGYEAFSVRSNPNWWARSNTTITWDLSQDPAELSLRSLVYPCSEDDVSLNAMQDVTWKSSSTKVADFRKDADGNVKLQIRDTGKTTITATAADGSGKRVSFILNVVRTVTKLTIEDQTVLSGKSLNLAKLVTVEPANATNKKLGWKIVSGGSYATLSTSGTFKAKKVNTSKTVEVQVYSLDGGASATLRVAINPA